jgi:hypothetical protein
MFNLSDVLFLLAVSISFIVSAYLWFNGNQLEGIFTAMWVPSILAFAIYFKLTYLVSKSRDEDQ